MDPHDVFSAFCVLSINNSHCMNHLVQYNKDCFVRLDET